MTKPTPPENTPAIPSVEWIATAASRIFAGRPDLDTAAATGAALELWNRAARLAISGEPPDPWKLAFKKGHAFEQERARLAGSGIDIDAAAGRRTLEFVADALQPPKSPKKTRARLADLAAIAKEALRHLEQDMALLSEWKVHPDSARGRKDALETVLVEAGEGLGAGRVAVSTARALFTARARRISTGKSEAGQEGGRPKKRPQRGK